MRIYASTTFYSYDGIAVIGGQVGSPNWYQQYTCTITAGLIDVPEVSLQTTTDSNVRNATYTAVFYDQAGRQQNTLLGNFFVDPQYLQSSVQSNIIVSGAGSTAANGTYTYRGEHNTRGYWNLFGQSDSTTNYAIVWTGSAWIMTNFAGATLYTIDTSSQYPWDSLWTIESGNTGIAPVPAVAQSTVVVGATWAELTISNQGFVPNFWTRTTWDVQQIKQYINLIGNNVPWASKIVGGKTYLTRDPVLTTEPRAIATNDYTWLALNKTVYLDGSTYQGDLDAALTAIGSTVTELRITGNCAVTATTSIPANILVSLEGDGKFTVSGGHTLTIHSMREQPVKKIFYTNSSGDNVLLGLRAVSEMNLSWWAGLGTGSDDNHAFAQVVASLVLNQGGRVNIPGATYFCDSDAFTLTQYASACHWTGAGSRFDADGGTILQIIDESSSKSVMKTFQSVSQMIFEDICFHTNTSLTAQCVLIDGIQGGGSAYNIKFVNCVFANGGTVVGSYLDATPAVDIYSEGINTDWEAVGIIFENSYFNIGENGVGLRSNTVNNSIDLIHPFFVGKVGAVGWLSKDSGWCTVTNPDFRGNSINYETGVTEVLDRTLTHVNIVFPTNTFNPGDINTSSSTIYIDSAVLYPGDRVQFTTTGSLVGTGISLLTNYYVKWYNPDTKLIQLSPTTDIYNDTLSLTGHGTGVHTLHVNGTHHVNLGGATATTLSYDDLAQRVVIGAIDTYFNTIIDQYNALTYTLLTTAFSDTTTPVYRQTAGTGLMYAGIVFAGNRAQTTINNGAAEGVLYSFVFESTTTEVYNQIALNGYNAIGRIRFNGTVILEATGCTFWSCSFSQSGGLGVIIADGGGNVVIHTTVYRGEGSFIGARVLPQGFLYGDHVSAFRNPMQQFIRETDHFTANFAPSTESLKITDLTPSGDADNTKSCLEIGTTLSQPDAIDKVLLWLGQVDAATGARKNGYRFTRSGTTGHLVISADEDTDAFFKGVDFEDYLYAPRVTQLDSVGHVLVHDPRSGIGYGEGAGGYVEQITSRTTPVTINKICGTIATATNSLAPGAEATFTVNNSVVEAYDTIALSQSFNYGYSLIYVSRVTTGAFDITVYNKDAAVSDTVQHYFNWAIIRTVRT